MKRMFRRAAFAAAALFPILATAPSALAQSPACQGVQGAGKVRLTVTATELRNGNGEVAFTLYPDDPGRFLSKGGKLLRARIAARAPATTACFWVTPGHYAIATYHDENGDRNFNRTLFTIKEGFGFSNDASTTLGIPKFERVRFGVGAAGGGIRVRTRYSR